jgi:endo-1,4-beta-xylanase
MAWNETPMGRFPLLLALFLLGPAGCGGNGDGGPCPLDPASDCTLREAADCAGLRIGVAAAPRGTTRDQLILDEFNALSPEGELIWRLVHPGPDEWEHEPVDQVLDFAHENGLFTTVSHFVWDQMVEFAGTPGWVKEITDPDELRRVMREHLSALTARHGEKIDRWIVVNEPLAYFGDTLYENHFHQVLGQDYIADTFRIAAEEAPGSELWINEIFLEGNPAKCDAYVELVRGLVDDGVPVDGAGMQGHLFFGEPDFDLVDETLGRLAALGVKVAVTELDAPVDPAEGSQAERLELHAFRMARMVEACLKVEACGAVTVWGLDDGQSWLNWLLGPDMSPLLYDENLQPKPSYHSVRDTLLAGRP